MRLNDHAPDRLGLRVIRGEKGICPRITRKKKENQPLRPLQLYGRMQPYLFAL